MKTAAALLAAALAAPALAQTPKPKLTSTLPGASAKASAQSEPDSGVPPVMLRVAVTALYRGLSERADFLVRNGSQANYVEGGETAFSVANGSGKSVEYKKHGFIVNVLPLVDPNDPSRVSLQFQLELSGPVKADPAPDMATWQLQDEVVLTKGKRFEVSHGAGRVDVTVSDAAAAD